MSISKFGRKYFLACDNCGKEYEVPFDDFHEAVEAKKEDGWKSKKINGEWEDWCPDCQQGGLK